MTDIRVTYTGLISLSIRLSSIITGLIFTLITTRELTQEEFGVWGLINGVIIYALVIHPIITYWATREIARGEESGKTVFLSSSMFSIIGIGIYIVLAVFVTSQSSGEFEMIIFASILIPAIFLNDSLSAISLGSKPHIVSYGFLVFELVKIPLAFIFVYFMQMGLEGAIIATFGAYIPSIIIMVIKTRHVLKNSFDKKFIKKWVKLFWIPTYRNIPSLISMSDVVVFFGITGSVVGVAYYTAAKTIGFLVNHTRSLSDALYPKLLETGKENYLDENLIKLFYFAFPLIGFSIVFAKPGLFALNPIYEIAEPVVILLAIRSFLTTIGKVLFQSLQGVEKVDIDNNSTFKDYIHSKLILFPTFQLIRNIVYFTSLALILFLLHSEKDEIELVIYWSVIGLIVEIPLTVYIYKLTKKNMQLNIDLSSLVKYLFSTITVFGGIYVVITMFLEYKNSIFEFLPQILSLSVISILGYIGLTYLIDNKTRILVKAIINEVFSKEKK